jgi:EPS-associated MarR family transcriptional regulator
VRLNDEVRYRLMRLVAARPETSQRELARELGISLGKLNFCLRVLVQKGLIKAINFKSSKNKAGYLYFLTPRGAEEKGRITIRFLQRKLAEYESIRVEIEEIRREAEQSTNESNSGVPE